MRHAIATVCLSGALEEKLAAAAHAGFDGVELFESDLIGSPLSPADVRARAEDLGLEVLLYQPFRDFEAVPDHTLRRNLARAERKFDVMEQMGADTLLVCSNVSESAIDDDARAVDQLRRLADRAAARGMRIAYEALAWGRHVRDLDCAWRIVAAADHPALGICLDSFHILSRGNDPALIRSMPGEKIFFLQLADAPYLVMDVLQWSRHYRCFPGQGGFDLHGFMDHVHAAGYDGPLSLEVFNDVFRQADPNRMAVDGRRSLLLLEGSLPPAPELAGYAFVELAVDETWAPEAERTLLALGFTHAGQHRSKPVQLWRAGGNSLLLNRSGSDARGPRVAAIGVESSDPGQSAARAETLLAPILSRPHRPDEADLAAIAAPDGTSIFFCHTDPRGGGWLGDFIRADDAPDRLGLTGVDHVALSQPFDYFDEAALFYRSVLDLAPRTSEELAGPDGLVRSRVVADRAGTVRFALNVPLLAHNGDGELQHVAFACDDVLAAARELRARGLPLLRIPGNYYEDLEARLDLDPELVEDMRDLGVLYDSDDHGELLQVYTPLLGNRLFFEMLERRGGYDGYGAANSPVRMVAQRALASDDLTARGVTTEP